MKNKRVIIAVIITALTAAACFFLPALTLHAQDLRLSGSIETASIDEADLSLFSNLSTVQKMLLISSKASSVTLEKGRFMDGSQAAEAAKSALSSIGIISDGLTASQPECRASLLIGEDDSSIVLWTVRFSEQTFDITLTLDDETGMILGFRFYGFMPLFSSEYESTDKGINISGSYSVWEIFDQVSYIYFYEYLGLDSPNMIINGNNTVTYEIFDEESSGAVSASYYPDGPYLSVNAVE
ncbi:MAG: hypothetical protein ACI3VB_03700 [Oscillospiraceae bacterium]